MSSRSKMHNKTVKNQKRGVKHQHQHDNEQLKITRKLQNEPMANNDVKQTVYKPQAIKYE